MIVVIHIALFALLTLSVWTLRRAFEWLLARGTKDVAPQAVPTSPDETPRRAA